MERKSFERVSQTPPLVGQGGGAGLLQVVVKGGSLIVKEGGSRLAPEHPSPGHRPAVSSNPKFVIRTDLLTAAAELVSHLLHFITGQSNRSDGQNNFISQRTSDCWMSPHHPMVITQESLCMRWRPQLRDVDPPTSEHHSSLK